MNITTKSGKTIAVDDESYVIDLGNGVVKNVFMSAQSRRLYTIDADDVEIFDEEWTDERLNTIIEMAGTTLTKPGDGAASLYI